MRVRYSLLADGTSDRTLMQIIAWVLRRMSVAVEQASWADLALLAPRPRSLAERVDAALRLYPCDILFVHRDAEREPFETRLQEVRDAVAFDRHVPIIPVRMTEAWFLHDERAIRMASGNPNGKVALGLPGIGAVEALPNPKEDLRNALLIASELKGRKRERRARDFPQMRVRVAELIDDFSPLDGVPAFGHFLTHLREVLQALENAAESRQRSQLD